MSKDVVNNKDDELYRTEPQLTSGEAFKAFLYDPNTGAVLGRTGANWVKLFIFYILFYIVLAALFASCMWLFLLTLNDDGPKYYLDESLIGTSPGLGYRPMAKDNEDSTLIWYNSTSKENHRNWTMGLEEFLKEYRDNKNNSAFVKCNYSKKREAGKVCAVNVDDWTPCTVANEFDYPSSKPCVFIKLNKILNWVPDYYDNAKDLPAKMPADLKKYIETTAKKNPKELKTVWVSCEGENSADKEHVGTIEYIPNRGFPGYYYPFEGLSDYLSPLVAIHFKSITKNVLVNIECKAWAHSIKHDRRDRVGMVHFELMVD